MTIRKKFTLLTMFSSALFLIVFTNFPKNIEIIQYVSDVKLLDFRKVAEDPIKETMKVGIKDRPMHEKLKKYFILLAKSKNMTSYDIKYINELLHIEHKPDNKTSTNLRKRIPDLMKNNEFSSFMETQKARHGHIREVCIERPGSFAPIPHATYVYDRNHNFILCPVYKVASSSISWMLMSLYGFYPNIFNDKLEIQLALDIFQLKSKYLTLDEFENSVTLMIVRHPFERLVSAYRDKIEFGNKIYYYRNYGERLVYKYRQRPPNVTRVEVMQDLRFILTLLENGRRDLLPDSIYTKPVGPTFHEFILDVIDPSTKDNEHWISYDSQCSPCTRKYEFILRFENLRSEAKQFIKYIDRENQFGLAKVNAAEDRGDIKSVDAVCKYFNQLSLSEIIAIVNKYHNDFILYDYDPTIYYKCAHDFYNEKNK